MGDRISTSESEVGRVDALGEDPNRQAWSSIHSQYLLGKMLWVETLPGLPAWESPQRTLVVESSEVLAAFPSMPSWIHMSGSKMDGCR